MPRHALTNIELKKFASILKIPYFRGIFMSNDLPKSIRTNECGIVNLDDKNSNETHWTAYIKQGTRAIYFDPFGNLKAPLELTNYIKGHYSTLLQYNYDALQTYNSYNCGHLCLKFLYNIYH